MATSPLRPNFFLVGAAKSGTTSLAMYLGQHPDVFLSNPKEPNYFAFPSGQPPRCRGPGDEQRMAEVLLGYSVTDLDAYNRLFSGGAGATAVGEASVRYLYQPDSSERIAAYAPDARIIAILRNPVDRMYSHYHMNVRYGFEPEGFRRALELEDQRVEQGYGFDWRYRRLGCYAEQLERYFDHFGRERVLVLFQDDLLARPSETLAGAYRHLGVDPAFNADTTRRGMVGSAVRWAWLRRFLWGQNPLKRAAKRLAPAGLRRGVSQRLERWNRGGAPALKESDRQELAGGFAEADQRLSRLLGRRLPW